MSKNINQEVIRLFFEIGRQIRKRVMHDSGCGLNMPQLFAMMYIKDHDDARMGDISEMLGIKEASATSLIEGLVKEKFVQRYADKNDRRVVYLKITKTADRLLEAKWRKQVAKVLTLDGLSVSEVKQFQKLLTKLNLNLK